MKALILTALTAAVVLTTACGNKKESLFNGKDLDGWVPVLASSEQAPSRPTFYAENGNLCISGEPFGYIRTEKKYADYTLYLEWRWSGGKAVDGGIFHFLQEGDKVWPVGVQCQMTPADMGVLMGGIPLEGVDDGGRGFYRKDRLTEASAENPVGEWNRMEFRCVGGHISVFLNGLLVNEANCSAREGYIGFQSEGGALQFRKLYLTRK